MQSKGLFYMLCAIFWFDKHDGYGKHFFDPTLISNHYQFYKEQFHLLKEQALLPSNAFHPNDLLDDVIHHTNVIQAEDPFDPFGTDIDSLQSTKNIQSLKQNPFRILTQTDGNHPFYRCIRNPLLFFHIERKVMVGQLSSDSSQFQYGNGHIYSLLTDQTEGASVQMDWSKREAWDVMNVELKASLSAPLKIFSGGLGARTSVNISQQNQNSLSKRGDERMSKSIALAVNQMNVQMAFDQYKQCLLIRPKSQAFRQGNDVPDSIWNDDFADHFSEATQSFIRLAYLQSGLLICDEEKELGDNINEPLSVNEKYYYIQQFLEGTLMNL